MLECGHGGNEMEEEKQERLSLVVQERDQAAAAIYGATHYAGTQRDPLGRVHSLRADRGHARSYGLHHVHHRLRQFPRILFFFGHLCREQHAGLEPTPNGVFTFCEKFESEIFRTGLGILAGIILLATSSFLRNRIPYEIFYYGHHVVFAIFTLAIAHTMDQKARDHGQERSQSFKWFTATLTLYIADRLFMGFNMRSLPVVEWSALGDRMQEDTRFVIVRLQKPRSFTFNPRASHPARPPTVFANDKRHVMASFIQLKYRLWQFHKRVVGSATFKGLERKKKEEERQVLWRLLALIPPILELAVVVFAK
ncbi:hypothetical protein CYMTET_56275 [Cymbomonas tetramitiformis]|uniref:Uncharacterized protein n=1 Tax=Cymbomonas tetramitiformis TaxID=36881 RepID=A0AAE0BCH2_9CHLO|nr:hypothetical protein CYMTET_56275 [Cymbomonas tetramitiformis]